MRLSCYLLLSIFLLHFHKISGWLESRRKCPRKNCIMGVWGAWSDCSATCGYLGVMERTRVKVEVEKCGGHCWNKFKDTRDCNIKCCPMNCDYSVGSWNACRGCGKNGTQVASIRVLIRPYCGGKACPKDNTVTRNCDTGR